MLIVTGFRKRPRTSKYIDYQEQCGQEMVDGTRIGDRSQKPSYNFILCDQKHYLTMKTSPFVLATWLVLASFGGWVSVSVKNDDVEVTVVAVLYVAAFLL